MADLVAGQRMAVATWRGRDRGERGERVAPVTGASDSVARRFPRG
jgi:hypothetical protein